LREVLRGSELPAQWQKYPLTTQEELMRGRDSLADHALWRWADEGEAWLRLKFENSGLAFHTTANIEDRTITLDVYSLSMGQSKPSLTITEPAVGFVSHLTVTKIILIAG
jgi:hypothetical protein